MKKNRPGTMVSVIASPEMIDTLAQIIFAETSTLGVRTYEAQRRVMARTIDEVTTVYGNIRVKHAGNGSFAPEFDDCRTAAVAQGVPLRTVIAEATEAFRQRSK